MFSAILVVALLGGVESAAQKGTDAKAKATAAQKSDLKVSQKAHRKAKGKGKAKARTCSSRACRRSDRRAGGGRVRLFQGR
jgi:uncharacterized protein YlxW (UPF0749 family)